jgi:hypothetical protein
MSPRFTGGDSAPGSARSGMRRSTPVGIKSRCEHQAEARNTDWSLCSTVSGCKEPTQHLRPRSCCAVDFSQACVGMPHSLTSTRTGSDATAAWTILVHLLKRREKPRPWRGKPRLKTVGHCTVQQRHEKDFRSYSPDRHGGDIDVERSRDLI